MVYLKLFLIFFKLGIFTFGGGYAMIPQIKDEIIEKHKWMTEDEVLEIIAIAESTPGPMAINMATYIGYTKGKFLGSLLATLGVVLPSLTIIFIISLFFDQFIANKYVAYAFVGIKCAVAFLILKAGVGMIMKMKKNIFNIVILCLIVGILITFELISFSFSSIFLILAGGVLGLIIYAIIDKKTKKKEPLKVEAETEENTNEVSEEEVNDNDLS
ncbi:MAG: chromate transporter [Acholeplasmatales bacterium]|nr:chromate transporter [Acholeplasmatales bacterium]